MKNKLLLFSLLVSSLFAFGQNNQYILNVHITDKSGSAVASHPVVILKENGPKKILTGKDGFARDTSLLKPGYTATYTISIEDPCMNAPYTTAVKTFPGTENIKYTLCNSIISNPCKVSFKAVATDAKQQTFTFVAEPQDPSYKYSWEFGDGTTGEGSKIQHFYAKPGVYVITVKMVTPDGCVAVYTDKLQVGSTTPTPNPSLLTCTCCASMDISLSNDSSNIYFFKAKAGFKDAIFNWTIDGVTITGNEAKYKFNKGGSYIIQLQAKSNECEVKINKTLIVKAPTTGGGGTDPNDCKIDFSYAYLSNTSNEVKFKPLLIDPTIAAQYFWSFGDGTSSSEMSPVHKFPKSGTYSVTLVVYFGNAKKCTITKEVTIKVNFSGNIDSESGIGISKVYPNPVISDQLTIDIKAIKAGMVDIQIFNQSNQLIKNIPAWLNPGENTIIFNLETIQNGIYYAVVNNDGLVTKGEAFMISR